MNPADCYDPEVQYTRHALSALMPVHGPAELKDLAADIAANGQRDPIVVIGEEILDGWNRYQACLMNAEDGETPDVWMEEFDTESHGPSPEQYVLSKNILRRNLSTEEKVASATALLGYINEGKKGRKAKGAVTLQSIANAIGVSAKTVSRALAKGKAEKGKPKEKRPDTLESLESQLRMAEGRVSSLKERIAALRTPAPTLARATAKPVRRTR